MAGERVRAEIRAAVAKLVEEEKTPLSLVEKDRVIEEVLDEVFGLGPLEPLLQDPTISRHSGDHAASWSTWSAAANCTARRWSSRTTRTCCASSKRWCRAWAGAWTNPRRWWTPACPTARASTPPFRRWRWTARCSPSAVSAGTPLQGEDLVRQAGPDRRHAGTAARRCVKARLNILICGGTGSGKTTLLNALSCYIPEDERIVTIEDAAELRCSRRTWRAWKRGRPTWKARAPSTSAQLVINALRMRPDRIIVGEVRARRSAGHAAGHEHRPRRIADHHPRQHPARRSGPPGSDGRHGQRQHGRPLHPPADCVGGRPVRAGVALQRRHPPHHAHHRSGRHGRQDIITLQDIFLFEKTGIAENGKVLGRFRATGIRPKFYERLKACGITLPPQMFQTVVEIN